MDAAADLEGTSHARAREERFVADRQIDKRRMDAFRVSNHGIWLGMVRVGGDDNQPSHRVKSQAPVCSAEALFVTQL